MTKNNTTTAVAALNPFEQDKARAFEYMVKSGWNAERMLVVKAMVDPEVTDDMREDYAWTYTPGYVRRGFRQVALRLESEGNTDLAEVFWNLRDDLDPYTGEWFKIESESDEDVA